MSDRTDFYFRQRVSEAELDLAFSLLEQADRNLASDLGVRGVISGGVPAPHSPLPDLTIDLTAPARAYDNLGQRLFYGTGQTISCAADLAGIPTDVATAGNERWLGVFLRFRRQLSDPRTDGNSQQVFFRRDESFELVVRQAPEGSVGLAPKPALQADEILLCDVRRRPGQTQIVAADIDISRRQAFVFVQGSSVAVEPGIWDVLQPALPTVQSSLDEVDAELFDHFLGADRRHAATAIDYTPHAFIAASNVQAAMDELIDDLTTGVTGGSGSSRIGVDAAVGVPHALPAGSVKSQLVQLLGFLNAHVVASAGAHSAAAVAATPHGNIAATNVQAQLQEVVADLANVVATAPGAGLVGMDALAGSPVALGAGTVRSSLAALVAALNAHASRTSAAHPASAVTMADAGEKLNASDAEGAIAEVLDAFDGEHFRANEVAAGQHRTIRQPALGGSKALILDSGASGQPTTRLRIYADAESVWFTLNASWNDNAWARDNTGYYSSGLRLSRNDFEMLHESTLAPTFMAWSRGWRLPMGGPVTSAFELSGAMQEVGHVGIEYTNADSIVRDLGFGSSVTFRNRFPVTPSSITFSPYNQSPSFSGNPSLFFADRDGFGYYAVQRFVASATAWWFGNYIAVA